jgi:hypothetical protein
MAASCQALRVGGPYRIEVVNYAAPPGTTVRLTLTFFDSAGQPGS